MVQYRINVVVREHAGTPGIDVEDAFPTRELAEQFIKSSDCSDELRIVERYDGRPFFTESSDAASRDV